MAAELLSGYQQRARIHLGITPDNAEQWRAAARDQMLEPADRIVPGRSDESVLPLRTGLFVTWRSAPWCCCT